VSGRPSADQVLDEAIELAMLLNEAPQDPELARLVIEFSRRSDRHHAAWLRVRSLPSSRAR